MTKKTDYNSLSFRWAVVGLCADATPSITANVRQMSGKISFVRHKGRGRVERGSFTLTLSQNRAWKSPLTRFFTLNSLYIDIILVSDLSANDRTDCGLCSLSLAAKWKLVQMRAEIQIYLKAMPSAAEVAGTESLDNGLAMETLVFPAYPIGKHHVQVVRNLWG